MGIGIVGGAKVLFNILSCVMVWVISFTIFGAIWVKGHEEKIVGMAFLMATTLLIIFMWLMTWQNWWR